jgi:hypothetical protein
MRGIFRGGYDVLHVNIATAMIEALKTEKDYRQCGVPMISGDEPLVVDPVREFGESDDAGQRHVAGPRIVRIRHRPGKPERRFAPFL